MDRSRCETLEHIRLDYLIDRGGSGLRIGWREVIRDAWWGILVWLAACLFFLFVGGVEWVSVPVGVWLFLFAVTAVIRLSSGHRIRCSLMYGAYLPFQIGEQV
jgi:hypothetical protein